MLKRINLFRCLVASNMRRLSSPYKATFAMTYRCNLRCHICRIWEQPPAAELSLGDIAQIFKNFKNLAWLDLTGGEVTLREDVVDVIRVIAQNAPKLILFHISTNGQRPEKALLMARAVLSAGLVPVINVSVDGPAAINDTLRGVKGAFAKSMETFKQLKAENPRGHYYLSCTLSNQNLLYVEEMLADIKKVVPAFTHADIHFNLCHTSAHYYKNSTVGADRGMDARLVMKYMSLSKNGSWMKVLLENQYLKKMALFLSGNRFPITCQALNATCFIDPCGRVYPCGIFDEPVGLLRDFDNDMGRLWRQGVVMKGRERIEQHKCPGCWSPCEAYPAILGGVRCWR
ncbi:MAG: radical SAM protein [Candidatus Omnitrophota bacterium]